MNRGILFAVLITLAWSGLFHSCRTSVDDEQLRTVDSLHTVMDKGSRMLTALNIQTYERADTAYLQSQVKAMEQRKDTLNRAHAVAIGDRFIVLREAERMATDHNALMHEVSSTQLRLTDLRNDINSGAMDPDAARNAIYAEGHRATDLGTSITNLVDAYERLNIAMNGSMLADTTSK